MKNLPLFYMILVFGFQLANADSTTTQNKNITILTGKISSDGKSEVLERLLEECITSLPKATELEPVISSDAKFMKEINGNPSRNEFMKTFMAVIEINYMVYQKVLFIVTTNTVPVHEPMMKEMEKNIQETKRFESSSSNGDMYAGRSLREYFFSTAEGAAGDVRKKAEAWLKQQSAIICKHK